MRRRALLYVGLLVALPLRAMAEPAISAALHPREVTLGQDARLAITVSGARSVSGPSIPRVDGLEIRNLGRTSSFEFVNGEMTSQAIYTFLVRPLRTGAFTIPALAATADAERLITAPIVLRTVQAGAVPRRAAPPPIRDAEPTVKDETERAPVLLRIVGVPERELFVGEVIPIELQLYVREGTRVTQATPPQLAGKDFTLSRPADQEPRQSVVRYGDARYTRLVFPAALSPIRAGKLTLQASLEVTAVVPEQRRRAFADPFFDSFFSSGMFGRGVERKLPIESPSRTVAVSALPQAGRPAEFSGGVGRFRVAVQGDPRRVAVGDPITVKTTVQGRGSFDRLQLAPLETSGSWKTYDMSSRFTKRDDLGIEGEKVFEQALVPLRPDVQEVQARELAYFDPDAGRYVTISVPAIPLEVLPAPSHPAARAKRHEAGASDEAATYELAPNRIDLGRLQGDLGPSPSGWRLVTLQLVPIGLLVASLVYARRRQRLAGDPAWVHGRRTRHSLKRLAAEMRRARAEDSPREFFAAARRAIQERLAVNEPERVAASLTLDEIERRIADRPELLAEVREVFLAADHVAYARGEELGAALENWQARVQRILADLDGASR